jgi:hypothetical protein
MKFRTISWLCVIVFVSAMTLQAATPDSGTLSAPPPGGTSAVSWSGGPYSGVTADPSLCSSLTCDAYQLTLNVPSDFFSTNPNDSVIFQITWTDSVNDFDLYVYDSSGNLVGSSTGGAPETSETVDAGPLAPGNYQVQVVAFAVVNEPYNGTVTLGPEPTAPTGRARYKKGKFGFTKPLALVGPSDALLSVQELEPRAAFDPLGNIYVASIQGVPAGTDVWKSYDGGQTFTYLGQPDGAQAAAALGARGFGAGGGDEDIATGGSGNVYVSSLWLGSVTQSTSFNGGAAWTENPVASDVPADDRMWVASSGNNVLYMTYKQLGTLTSGTESLLVVKSFDGGLTFPQVTQLTMPVSGVQPGTEGNIAVDPANGNVYLVFTGSSPNQLYLARSTDGGLTFITKLIYQGPTGANFGNVFPALAVDHGGGLHVVYADGKNIYLTSSADQGADWTTPVRVNNGVDTKTTLFPWISAGGSGEADIVWLGTPATNNLDSSAQWKVFFAQTTDAFAPVPAFSEQAATNVVHTGAVCTNGTGCPTGTRSLADYFTDTVYQDGSALIVYPNDQQTSSPLTYFIRQNGGAELGGP